MNQKVETGKETDKNAFSFQYTGECFTCKLRALIAIENSGLTRITRNRMVGYPPDIMLSPKLAHIGLLEFHRAKEAIQFRKFIDRL